MACLVFAGMLTSLRRGSGLGWSCSFLWKGDYCDFHSWKKGNKPCVELLTRTLRHFRALTRWSARAMQMNCVVNDPRPSQEHSGRWSCTNCIWQNSLSDLHAALSSRRLHNVGRHGGNGGNPQKRVSIKKNAGTIFSAASTNLLQILNSGFLRNVNPDKPILVHLRCLGDVCVIACLASAGYCVLFYGSGPVWGDSVYSEAVAI